MTETLTGYIAKGLVASLDELFDKYKDTKNRGKRRVIIKDMWSVQTNMRSYQAKGIPLSLDYINNMQVKINELENNLNEEK